MLEVVDVEGLSKGGGLLTSCQQAEFLRSERRLHRLEAHVRLAPLRHARHAVTACKLLHFLSSPLFLSSHGFKYELLNKFDDSKSKLTAAESCIPVLSNAIATERMHSLRAVEHIFGQASVVQTYRTLDQFPSLHRLRQSAFPLRSFILHVTCIITMFYDTSQYKLS